MLARTSLRRWHGSAISLARADAAQVGGDFRSSAASPVDFGITNNKAIDTRCFIIFIIHLALNIERRSSGGTESRSRAAGGAMKRGSGSSGGVNRGGTK